MKTLVDHHPEYRIPATGSAAVATKRKQAESGVGRWITVPIPSLSFYEYLRIRDVGILKLLDGLKLQDLFTSAVGVAALTVENHLKVLEHAHLICRLPLFAISGKKILKAKDKIYIADAALRNAVRLKGDRILDDPAEMGFVAETTVPWAGSSPAGNGSDARAPRRLRPPRLRIGQSRERRGPPPWL